MAVGGSIPSHMNLMASLVGESILPIMSPSSLHHVGTLGVQPVLDVVHVLDVEHAVLLDLHLGITVHAPRGRSPYPVAVDVVDAAVARAEELPVALRVSQPAHRAPEVSA